MAPPGSEFSLRTDIYPAIDPNQFKESLTGKVALVTGSGRGIGREIAIALAKSGAAVAITSRTTSEVEETRKEVEAIGVRTIGVVADGCNTADLERLVNEVTRRLGAIDILICNAGTNVFMPFHLTAAPDWWSLLEVMLKSPVELTRLILPSMRVRNAGTIIYTSSRAAQADLPWTTAYNCAKTSITRFAGSLQTEMSILQPMENDGKSNGIRIFSIHPGEVNTKLHETGFPEQTKKEAPYVIEMMDKLHATSPDYKVALPAWTCVYLAAGKGVGLEGRMVDCTRDVDEVRLKVLATPRPKFTNSCAAF